MYRILSKLLTITQFPTSLGHDPLENHQISSIFYCRFNFLDLQLITVSNCTQLMW